MRYTVPADTGQQQHELKNSKEKDAVVGRLHNRFHRGVRRLGAQRGKLRRRLGDFLWQTVPGVMERRLRRLAIPRPVITRSETLGDPLLLAAEAAELEYRPLISVLLPVYNTAPRYLRLAVDSVLAQAYPEWELVICNDGSSRKETLAALSEISALDTRIHVHHLRKNSGISLATNDSLGRAHGEFVAMLDHDDELLPGSLLEVAKVLGSDKTLDAIYTDQDYIEVDGSVSQTFYKPDWSLELFRGVMYVGHLLVVRRSLAVDLGGFDPKFDNVQDFEFMLRVAEKTDHIAHVPKVLYHWRKAPGSVAWDANEKSNIEERQAAAVNSHLIRCGVRATARSYPGHAHRLLIEPTSREDYPLASVILRGEGAVHNLEATCERLLNGRDHAPREVIVAGGRLNTDLTGRLTEMGVSLVAHDPGAGSATQAALEVAHGAVIVSMAGDLLFESADWLEHFMFCCSLPDVACVTPVVLTSEGTVDNAGLILGGDQALFAALRGSQPDEDGYAGSLACTREVSAVSGDCYAISRSVLACMGELDPYLASDLCQGMHLSLRATSLGFRNLCTPRIRALHQTPPVRSHRRADLDRLLLADAWMTLIERGDPFHNPNFVAAEPGYRT